jgi:hypothetical protein
MSDIREKKIDVNVKIRNHVKYNPPEPKNKSLPPCWFSFMSCSVKNSGKTYNVIQLLTAYENSGITQDGEECVMRTIWYSGSTATSKNNAIIRTLKSLAPEDIYDIDGANVNVLKEVYDDCLREKQEIEKYVEYEEIWNKWRKVGEDKLSALELLILDERDFVAPHKLEDKPLYKRPRVVFMVFDDLISNPSVFNLRKGNFLNKLIPLHRHDAPNLVPVNILLISQNWNSIPPIIRKNIDIFVLCKTANSQKLLESVINEVGGVISMKDLERMYFYATSFPFGTLIINLHPREEIRFRLGWQTELKIDDGMPCDCESRGKPKYSCGKSK